MSKGKDPIDILMEAMRSGGARKVGEGHFVIEDKRGDSGGAERPKDIQARVLVDMLDVVHRQNTFVVGDLLEQAPEFSRYKYPGDNDLCVVTEVLPVTTREWNNDGHPAERNDIIILTQAKGDWVEYPVESWRFRKYEGPVA